MSKKKRSQKVEGVETSKSPKDLSPKIPQRDKIDFQLSIRERDDLTEKQQELLDLILNKDTRVVFVVGPAGTAKSFLGVLAGLRLMNRRAVSDIIYIRSVIESASKSLGYLPGEKSSKLEPFLRPLKDKLEELLPSGEIDRLEKDNRIEGCPVNYLRGASFNARFMLIDESQNLTQKELVTVLTRAGRFSKVIVAGDPSQSDVNGSSGFQKMADMFNDEESRANGVHYFSFTKEDIVRSDLVRFIVGRIEERQAATVKNEPIFPPK